MSGYLYGELRVTKNHQTNHYSVDRIYDFCSPEVVKKTVSASGVFDILTLYKLDYYYYYYNYYYYYYYFLL